MTRMAKAKQQTPGPGREILAISIFFAALFLLLSLVSFSLPAAQSAEPVTSAANWCGTVGHFVAKGLMGFLGISSLWLVFLFFIFAGQCYFSQIFFERPVRILIGCIGLLISSSGLLAAAGYSGPGALHLAGRLYPTGGHIGKTIMTFLLNYLGWPGAILFLLFIFIFSLMFALRFSPYSTGVTLVRTGSRIRESFRQKMPAAPEPEPKDIYDYNDYAEPDEGPEAVPHVHETIRPPDRDEADDFQVMPVSAGEYQLPGIALLDKVESKEQEVDREHYYEISQRLEDKLKDFGVSGKVVGISPGPVVTTYEFAPAPGVKINKIVGLADDLALGLKAESVRIIGSIPGKAALGIEIPNPQREIVGVRDILASDSFRNSESMLTIGLGKDVVGKPVLADLVRMPHLLIAGATGSGKSVGINTIICSILFRASPEEVRFLMIDPKRIELSAYEEIPHLLHPVVVDPKMANRALQWAVREMERRYELMEEMRVKNFMTYNESAEEKLPLIVIVVDELADLMMVSSRDVEESIARLAQMARAAGMHMILATQRPSVDVLTGLIKANFPTRISFKVFSKIDSRTILDASGAEHLLGDGDMLFMPPGKARLQRIHGAYISEQEIDRIVSFIKEQGAVQYDESVLTIAEEVEEGGAGAADGEYDEKYDQAVAIVCETGQASISMVQRRLRVGYNRAARMIELMEKEGLVGPGDGSKPREVLARKTY